MACATAGLVVTGLLIVGGCGGEDNSSRGATTSAPPKTTAPAPTTTAEAPGGVASASAGKQVFQQTCSGCHAGLGTRAAFGPKLAGKGLSKATIRATVQNGRAQMPAGLVSGRDLEDIVAYVSSLQ